MSKKETFRKDMIGKDRINNRTKKLYRKSFGNLAPRSLYWDPLGKKTDDNKPFDLRSTMFEESKELLEKFDELHLGKGYSPSRAIKIIQKDVVDTGQWTLPTHILPEVRVVQPQRTPMADLMARITIDQKDFDVTARTSHNETDVEWDIENRLSGSDPQTASNVRYNYVTPNHESYEYEVNEYGFASYLTNPMQLASRTVRDSGEEVHESLSRSTRIAEENAIYYGGDADAWSADSFNGFSELGVNHANVDHGNVDIEDIESLIDAGLENGANSQNAAIVTSFGIYRNLKSEMKEYKRYDGATTELNFGISTFEIEDIPVFRSQAIDESDSDKMAAGNTFFVDMDSTYMAMLQDLNIDPIAKIGAGEDVAVHAIGTLVSESGDGSTTDAQHIQIISDT